MCFCYVVLACSPTIYPNPRVTLKIPRNGHKPPPLTQHGNTPTITTCLPQELSHKAPLLLGQLNMPRQGSRG